MKNPKCAVKGSKNGGAKLTEESVISLRLQRSNGKTIAEIADWFGISVSTAWYAVNRVTWKHVP